MKGQIKRESEKWVKKKKKATLNKPQRKIHRIMSQPQILLLI
jgi:hypothetical protein